MPPPTRSDGNYRFYGEADMHRLMQIRAYRDAGLKLEDIRAILGRTGGDAFGVLKRRLLELDAEIGTLRNHQQAILKLMGNKDIRKGKMITKQKWVSIMEACGFSSEQMHRWHSEFERSAPAEHQEFLEFLHISPDEINTIRERSKKGA
jgi:MerR family transcriptional regulator, thiopeptide resistance regulator